MPAEQKYTFDFEEGVGGELPADADWTQPQAPKEAAEKGGVQTDEEVEIVFEEPPPKEKAAAAGAGEEDLAPLPEPGQIRQPDPEVAALRQQMRQMQAMLAQQNAAALDTQFTEAKAGVARKIAEAREKLKTALDDSNASDAADAQIEIGRLTADERMIDAQHRQVKEQTQRAVQQPAPADQRQPQAEMPAELANWLGRNPWYYDESGKFARHKEIANEVDRKLAADGWDKTHPNYYRKLDEGLRAAMKGKHPAAERGGGVDPVAPASARGGGGGAPANAGNGKRIVLTHADKQMMMTLGMDLTNPKVVAAYAQEKAAEARKGQVRR